MDIDYVKQFSILFFDDNKRFISRLDFDNYNEFIDSNDNLEKYCPFGTHYYAWYLDGVFDGMGSFPTMTRNIHTVPVQLTFDF